ncbi:MAG: TIGR00375 family protein [Armatimonadetes bacterium]|nr:TIGR00375 family protein [Armatimonadota bacterium]NIO74600.1 TIGR00375 family protein [Armatimonadota bacterium]NIO96555.1 TIGR00375 family protein [Armatimonadota bacterium]
MAQIIADLHIHIGRSLAGRPIKITAARDLTFANIAKECVIRKGIDLAGIVDCASPAVISDIEALIASGEMEELAAGGLRFRGKTTLLLASELETAEPNGASSHHVSYFPTFAQLQEFSQRMSRLVSNLELSSQRCRLPAQQLWEITHSVGGLFIPAHAFTPHKSVYGTCVRRLSEMFNPRALKDIPAIELGLSADTDLADTLKELADISFLTNSDAHSLPKIAREYNILEVEEPTFTEVAMALRRQNGRRVIANYGLDPRLGKYHRTHCPTCNYITPGPPPVLQCPRCDSEKVIKGVLDRLREIGDWKEPHHPEHRPPYQYQVPLQFLPGIGAVTLGKLLNRFGTEMAVLHRAEEEEIARTVGFKLAQVVMQARAGSLPLEAGGGGHYGRAITNAAETQMPLL